MSNFVITIIIIAAVCGSGVAFAYLKKKGVKMDTVIKDVETAADDAGVIIKAGKSLSGNKAFDILDLIDTFAKKAVNAVEQLYISNQLPSDQRKSKAKEIILNNLKLVGIKETAEIDTMIDMIIESIVFDSKTDVEKKGQEDTTLKNQITQLTAEKTQLQSQVIAANSNIAKAQQEIITLKNKLSTIQTAIANGTSTQQAVTAVKEVTPNVINVSK